MNLSLYGMVSENFSLMKYNTYRLDVKCKYFIIVNQEEKLLELIKYLTANNYKYFILGNGSNIILPNFYDGIIIKLQFSKIEFEGNQIIVGSSVYLPELVTKTINKDLSGLEFASGIPGTIGGSIINNAGAYNDEIMNYVKEVKVIKNNTIEVIKKDLIDFSYRWTSLKQEKIIIIEARLELKIGNKEQSIQIIQDRYNRRIASQPLEYPSAGSVFRNPEGNYAGALIEASGLKGYSIGGAKISEKHANFIINYHNAKSEDIISLINYIQKIILNEYNINLILEQEIIN